jgi:hypothetical protein
VKTPYLLSAVTTAAAMALGSPAVAHAAGPQHAIPQDVLLPTGDHVLVTGDTVVVVPRPGIGYLREKINGDTYVVPTDALGHGDPARFDVTALAHGVAPTTAAHPNFPMHTVTLDVLDADGRPAAAALNVINLDNMRLYQGFPFAEDGQARISVPSGHYGLTAYVPSRDGDRVTELRVLSRVITVTDDQTVTLDARSATAPVSVQTPRPAQLTDLAVHSAWRDATKLGWLESEFDTPNVPVLLTPDAAPPVGERLLHVTAHLESADYTYDLAFRESGAIPADQRHRVTADQLQTLHANYFGHLNAGIARAFWAVGMDLPNQTLHPVTAPLRRTEYVGGASDLITNDVVVADAAKLTGLTFDGVRAVQPANTRTVDWLREPLTPGLLQPTAVITNPSTPAASVWGWGCADCRTGDTLDVGVQPANDSDPGHSIILEDKDIASSHLVLSANGTVYADTQSSSSGPVTVPAAEAVYHLVYDATVKPEWLGHSTTSHTEWTFKSGHSGTRTVPDNWSCDITGGVDQCSALPLLDVRYNLDDKTVAFAHAPAAAASPITKAGAEISYDGKTWRPVPLISLGDGKFRALWLGQPKALKVSATDAAGNALQQTVSY